MMTPEGITEDRYVDGGDGQLTFNECRAEDERLDAAVPVFISKSNALIKRIGKTTLLSEQALLVAIYKAKMRTRDSIAGTALEAYYDRLKEKSGSDFAEGLIATFTSSELKQMMNIKTSRYAAAMDELMNMNVFTNSWHILYNDNGVIADTACVMGSVYDKRTGRVTIKFNSDIADRILNIKTTGGYTVLDSSIMSSVSKDLITWSVYQLLREEISYREALNRRKGFPPRKEYMTEFGFSEFKFLATVNQVDLASKSPDQIACARLLKERNYEEAEQVLPKDSRMYDTWKAFRARVLARTCLTINGWEGSGCYDDGDAEYERLCGECHPTDIHFRCVPVKSGQGAKVIGIRFYIRWDEEWKSQQQAPKLADGAKQAEPAPVTAAPGAVSEMDFIAEMSEMMDEAMKVADMRHIAKLSGYDLARIRSAYGELKAAGEEVSAAALAVKVASQPARRQEAPPAPAPMLSADRFPGFDAEELMLLYRESAKHRPKGWDGSERQWAERYAAYYRDKIGDDPDGTRTTVFRRLMDCLRRDYDGFALEKEPARRASGSRAPGYMQRDYSGLDFFLLEVRKGVRVLSGEEMAVIESGDREAVRRLYERHMGAE